LSVEMGRRSLGYNNEVSALKVAHIQQTHDLKIAANCGAFAFA
jgi:hypothetical protein